MRRLAWLVALPCAIVACGTHASAQGGSVSLAPGIRELACTFTGSVSATWKGTALDVAARSAPVIAFRIGNIGAAHDSADLMIGALTVPEVVIVTGTTLHFIEPPASGATAITSVVVQNGSNRFPASYSRTEYYAYDGPGFASAPQAEQYYGYCVPAGR